MDITHADHCDAVEAEIAAFAEVIRGADPKTQVSSCGNWRLSTLVQHIGGLHNWVTGMVTQRSMTRNSRRVADHPIPASSQDHPQWLLDGGEALLAALRSADPGQPVWVWGDNPRVGWWSRRMRHETGIHRADASLALGQWPEFSTETAADGVDEFLTNLPSAARFAFDVRKLRGDGQRIALRATDAGQSWRITLEPKGFAWERAKGPADATVSASAADLYLFVWGRLRAGDSRVELAGDRGLMDHWVTHSAI